METFKLYKVKDMSTKEEHMLLLSAECIWERLAYYGWYISDESDLNTVIEIQRGELLATMCMWCESTVSAALDTHQIIDTLHEGSLRDCIQHLRMLHLLGELNVK